MGKGGQAKTGSRQDPTPVLTSRLCAKKRPEDGHEKESDQRCGNQKFFVKEGDAGEGLDHGSDPGGGDTEKPLPDMKDEKNRYRTEQKLCHLRPEKARGRHMVDHAEKIGIKRHRLKNTRAHSFSGGDR